MINKKEAFALVLITALLTALCVINFCAKDDRADITLLRNQITNLQSHEQNVEKHYQSEEAKLQVKNDSLQKLVDTDKVQLAQVSVKATSLEKEVRSYATKVLSTPDTAKGKVSDLDSLARVSETLITQEDLRDSLCNKTIDGLTDQLTVADSADTICNKSYNALKMELDSSLRQQEDMAIEVKSLDKKLHRKTIQNKIFSAGMMIVTAIAATLFITQRP